MKPTIHQLINNMPKSWRSHWCEATIACACLGCANNSGGLTKAGFSKSDWIAATKQIVQAHDVYENPTNIDE